jgi:Arm DNA-binding domain
VGDKRKPGVRTGSDSSIEIDFYYRNKRCRERIGLKPTPRNINYAAKLKARIEHEIATGEFDYRKHFRTRREQSSSRNYRVMRLRSRPTFSHGCGTSARTSGIQH